MFTTKRFRLFLPLLVLLLLGAAADGQYQRDDFRPNPNFGRPSDMVRLVSLSPASGSVLAVANATLGPGNSVEATIDYALTTVPKAFISVYTTGEEGNPPHTGAEVGRYVTRGRGQIKTRFTVACDNNGRPAVNIVTIRVAMSDQSVSPVVMLSEERKRVEYKFTCLVRR